MTPMDAATLAVLDKIGGVLDGHTAQDVARDVAGAAIRAFITAIAPDPDRPATIVNPCCGSEIGHFPTCAARA